MKQRLFILSQYLLPHHLLSRLIGCAAECRATWFKSRLIAWFARRYQVDMREAAVEDLLRAGEIAVGHQLATGSRGLERRLQAPGRERPRDL